MNRIRTTRRGKGRNGIRYLLFSLCLLTAGPLYAGGATQLAKARASYQKKQAVIEKKYLEDLPASVAKQYTKLLSEYVDTYRAEGKLDEFLTAKEERERFQSTGTVEESDVLEEPEFVRNAQQQFIRITQSNHRKMLKQQAKLAKKYIRYLDGLQKKLMKKYLTDQALLVKEEINTVRASVDLSVLTPPRKPAQSKPGKKSNPQLKLATNWKMRFDRDDIAARDTARMLSKCGTPQIDLTKPEISIWGKVTYLMPLQEAKKLLGLRRSQKDSIDCAVFPPRSFFSHAFKGNFEDGFDQLYVITDFKDQVVGLQFQSNTSRPDRWFQYSNVYSTEWSLYNFVLDLKKSNPNWEVGMYICKGEETIMGYPPQYSLHGGPTGVNPGIIRIESDLFTITRDRYGLTRSQKSRARVRLLLAQPIVDLMLYVVQNSR